MTAIEIIDETVEFYKNNPRAISSTGNCFYNGPDGTHCAVGRCLLPKYKDLGEDLVCNFGDVKDLVNSNDLSSLDAMLEEKYHGHDIIFWKRLQTLHDSTNFWRDGKLTEKGKEQVNYGN